MYKQLDQVQWSQWSWEGQKEKGQKKEEPHGKSGNRLWDQKYYDDDNVDGDKDVDNNNNDVDHNAKNDDDNLVDDVEGVKYEDDFEVQPASVSLLASSPSPAPSLLLHLHTQEQLQEELNYRRILMIMIFLKIMIYHSEKYVAAMCWWLSQTRFWWW